jgi:hypothetical protein
MPGQAHPNISQLVEDIKRLNFQIRCELSDIFEQYNHWKQQVDIISTSQPYDNMTYVSLDIQFVGFAIIMVCVGILIGLYCNHSISPSTKVIVVESPPPIEKVHWDTHCRICTNSYEETYLANNNKRTVDVVILTPCYHTCCPTCFDTWYIKNNEHLKCFFCNCNVLFPLKHRIEFKPKN